MTFVEILLRDARYGIRSLARMRGLAAAAIVTLALGIGATTTMFSVVDAALLRSAPFAEADRLAILFNTITTPRDGTQRIRWSYPQFEMVAASVTSFESLASFTPPLVAISGQGDPEHVDA